jgi:hypothetical protein
MQSRSRWITGSTGFGGFVTRRKHHQAKASPGPAIVRAGSNASRRVAHTINSGWSRPLEQTPFRSTCNRTHHRTSRCRWCSIRSPQHTRNRIPCIGRSCWWHSTDQSRPAPPAGHQPAHPIPLPRPPTAFLRLGPIPLRPRLSEQPMTSSSSRLPRSPLRRSGSTTSQNPPPWQPRRLEHSGPHSTCSHSPVRTDNRRSSSKCTPGHNRTRRTWWCNTRRSNPSSEMAPT